MENEIIKFKKYIKENNLTKEQINLLFVTKLKLQEFGELPSSKLLQLLNFMDKFKN